MKLKIHTYLFIVFISIAFCAKIKAQCPTCVTLTSGNFTVPAGVTSITVYVFGGGGGAGGCISGASDQAGGGGGGGACTSTTFGVSAGNTCVITYGAGGAAGASGGGNGGNGGTTTLNYNGGTNIVTANGGGGGGGASTNGSAGAGGAAGTGGSGGTTFNGGAGLGGIRTINDETGGSGGGAGGSTGAGNAGTGTIAGTTGGAAGASAESGGAGASEAETNSSYNGTAGSSLGGGGGGCASYTSNRPGGAGGAGGVIICYTGAAIPLLTVGNSCTSYTNTSGWSGPYPTGCGDFSIPADITTLCGGDQLFIFQATQTNNYISINGTLGSCYSGCAVYGPFATATPGCPTTANLISCEDLASYTINQYNLPALTVGDYYIIQVMDFTCGGCTAGKWCITVVDPTTQNCSASTCAAPCGLAYSYNSASVPASWYDEAPRYGLSPAVPANTLSPTYCFYTQANNTSDQVNFGSAFSSCPCCGPPNCCGYSTYNWYIYSTSCTLLESNNFSNLNATGVTCNTQYIYCLNFTSNCPVDSISPYLYNAASSCSVTVLPIHLLNFEAALDTTNNNVDLHWATATEVNNNFFTILRSTDGRNFNSIGKVKASNNSTGLKNYLFVDTSAAEFRQDVLYYQLSETDINGKTTDFNIVEVNMNKDVSVKVYPNPSNGDFNLDYNIPQGSSMQVDLLDATGSTLSSNYYIGSGGLSQQKVQPQQPGMYILNITINGQVIHKKIVKL